MSILQMELPIVPLDFPYKHPFPFNFCNAVCFFSNSNICLCYKTIFYSDFRQPEGDYWTATYSV